MRLIVVFLLLALNGCSVPLYVLMFNNTSSVVEISTIDGVTTIAPRTHETFRIAPSSPVRVKTEGNELVFPFNGVPGEYYEPYKWNAHRVHIQLQPDRAIIAVKPSHTMPVSDSVVQPTGFPLLPKMVAFL